MRALTLLTPGVAAAAARGCPRAVRKRLAGASSSDIAAVGGGGLRHGCGRKSPVSERGPEDPGARPPSRPRSPAQPGRPRLTCLGLDLSLSCMVCMREGRGAALRGGGGCGPPLGGALASRADAPALVGASGTGGGPGTRRLALGSGGQH